ncbi:hypothetical protein VTL71DRAFT_274 [Oculimacula yallundae]|uniref:Uncharacterized protein n=1 Tax=Oculimacula yallundae TaxID=86028 RepID=A0ABR4D1V5_9HELO
MFAVKRLTMSDTSDTSHFHEFPCPLSAPPTEPLAIPSLIAYPPVDPLFSPLCKWAETATHTHAYPPSFQAVFGNEGVGQHSSSQSLKPFPASTAAYIWVASVREQRGPTTTNHSVATARFLTGTGDWRLTGIGRTAKQRPKISTVRASVSQSFAQSDNNSTSSVISHLRVLRPSLGVHLSIYGPLPFPSKRNTRTCSLPPLLQVPNKILEDLRTDSIITVNAALVSLAPASVRPCISRKIPPAPSTASFRRL